MTCPMSMTARAAAVPLNNDSKTHQASSMKIGAGRSRAVLVAMLMFCDSQKKRALYLWEHQVSRSIKCPPARLPARLSRVRVFQKLLLLSAFENDPRLLRIATVSHPSLFSDMRMVMQSLCLRATPCPPHVIVPNVFSLCSRSRSLAVHTWHACMHARAHALKHRHTHVEHQHAVSGRSRFTCR